MDVISEIIAYEKHAEEIVAQANKKAEAKKSGEEHCSATAAECNAVIKRLDDEFSKNRDKWTDEIYKNIISVE